MRGKILLLVFFLALAANIVFLVRFFLNSGGWGLVRVVWYYLLRNIPDKRYHWQDFTDRGSGMGINGFYSGGDDTGFYLWTLSGRKRFSHRPGISVYQFNDVCAAVRQWGERREMGKSAWTPTRVTGEIVEWQEWMKPAYLVGVTRLEDNGSKNAVDKVWSVSGRYKVPDQLTKEQCK